ncbi:MAG: SDR family oxidoreductase [Alphaproteobacteria bacterium]|nr:SDR family oxidoreductase [Alphaproteobacteria bacterium]
MTRLLEGKTAIVAGAAQELGAGIVRSFVRHGANVVAGDLSESAVRAIVAAVEPTAQGTGIRAIRLDVTKAVDWQGAVALAESAFGSLSILVNTAPASGRPGIEQTSEAEWDGTIDADLRGSWLGMKTCIPALRRAGGGAIVNTSSTSAMVGTGHSAAYHGAMAGVLMLTRTAAIEYAERNIRINAVLPGPIDPSQIAGLSEAQRQAIIAMTPMRRLANPEEVANTYVFLASDLASYMTGVGLVVDGGYTAI